MSYNYTIAYPQDLIVTLPGVIVWVISTVTYIPAKIGIKSCMHTMTFKMITYIADGIKQAESNRENSACHYDG